MPRSLPAAGAPITEDDGFIENALRRANLRALMMSLVHLTGDTSLLRGDIRPPPLVRGGNRGGSTREQRAEVRARALEVLARYRDEGSRLPPPPSHDTIHAMMSFAAGEPVSRDYVPMMLEELALDGRDAREVPFDERIPVEARQDFEVLVIGAGMSGLLAAIRLEEAGLPYTVIEKNEGIGGTWLENTYPGCRVDVGNHFYCYSFEPNHDWSEYFSGRDELHEYFERCGTRHGVREKIRFDTEVVSAHFDEPLSKWRVVVRERGGAEETIVVNAIISAVGQLNRPKVPEIEGLEEFAGPAFHSARWEHEHDLGGKRVAVVGTGASALQLVPEVAERAGQLLVFQRSPCWMLPNPNYHARVSDEVKWLMKHVPFYARWYRFLIFWPGSDGLWPALVIDPEWPHPERSINALNEEARERFTAYLEQQVGDDPELLEKVIPDYPPYGKRILQDDGRWLSTLKRDDVELVPEAVARVTHDAIITASGERHPVDVIIFATGFHANEFLAPMEIIGRGGVNLREHWGDDPSAYLGMTVPGFPNLFLLYGPGTNLAHAGSIIFHSECQVRYIMGCFEALLRRGCAALECKREVHEAFDEKLQSALAKMVWSHPGMNNWYKNSKGRVTTTSPWKLLDYWRWTKAPDLDDFEWTPS